MNVRLLLSLAALAATAGRAAADDYTGDAAGAPAEPAPPEAASEAAPTDAAPTDAAPTPPPAASPASMTLKQGGLVVAVNLEVNMSAERVAKPLSIAPDISYGVSDDLTVALVHSTYAATGFRAKAGGALCLTGKDNGCAGVYDNVGAEGWYALGRGQLAIAAGGGFHALSLDAGFYDVKLGAKLKYTAGKLAVVSMPSVFVGLTKRKVNDVALNKDSLWIPIQVTYKVTAPITVGVGSGIKGTLQGFGDAWQVPLGVSGTYTVNKQLTVGASWTFGALVGGATNPPDPAPGVKGLDPRGLQVWASYAVR